MADVQEQATMREIPDTLHIMGLVGSNFKILEAVDITLDDKGNLIPITGENGSGKSSLIDLVMAVLGGKNAMPAKAIREGETEMLGKVTLGNGSEVSLVVTRKAVKKGDSVTHSLKVVTADGSEVNSPQQVLDAIIGSFTFDPLGFAFLKPAEQTGQLLEVLGLTEQLDKVEAEIKAAEQERVIAGRERDQVKGQLTGLKAPTADTPAEPVDTQAVLQEIDEAQGVINKRNHLTSDIAARVEGIQRDMHTIQQLKQQITELEGKVKENEDAKTKAQKFLQGLPAVDIDALRNKLANAEHVNNAVREAAEYKALTAKLQEKTKLWETHDANIKKLRSSTSSLLKDADLGIDGLDIREKVIHLNGIPLEQASTAQQIVVGMKVAAKANPTLRVMFIREGSMIDSKNRALVAQFAKDNNYQIIMEMVSDGATGGGVGFVMNEGRVVEEMEAVSG